MRTDPDGPQSLTYYASLLFLIFAPPASATPRNKSDQGSAQDEMTKSGNLNHTAGLFGDAYRFASEGEFCKQMLIETDMALGQDAVGLSDSAGNLVQVADAVTLPMLSKPFQFQQQYIEQLVANLQAIVINLGQKRQLNLKSGYMPIRKEGFFGAERFAVKLASGTILGLRAD